MLGPRAGVVAKGGESLVAGVSRGLWTSVDSGKAGWAGGGRERYHRWVKEGKWCEISGHPKLLNLSERKELWQMYNYINEGRPFFAHNVILRRQIGLWAIVAASFGAFLGVWTVRDHFFPPGEQWNAYQKNKAYYGQEKSYK